MNNTITCPLCGKTYEIYNAYREDEWFKQKVDMLAEMNDRHPEYRTVGRWSPRRLIRTLVENATTLV